MSERSAATTIGILFLVALIFNLIASEVMDPILKSPDYLALASGRSGAVIIGNLLNFICAIAMIFIPIVLFPIARKRAPGLGAGYIVFRGLEGILFIYIAIRTLSFIGLSGAYRGADEASETVLSNLGAALHTEIEYATIVYVIIFALGAFVFYALLFRTRLVPRFLTIWGLLGTAVLSVGAALGLFNIGLFSDTAFMSGMAHFAPLIALNELVLAVWLIVRGFEKPAPGSTA